MNPAIRLGTELSQLAACLSARDFARYLWQLAAHSGQIMQSRSLVPADRVMDDDIALTLRGKQIVIPLRVVRQLLEAKDATPVFGAVREMYASALRALASANGLDQSRFERIGKFVASTSSAQSVTIGDIMERRGLDRIGFVKCDIEGAEFDGFCHNNAFLSRVDNIAMELHPQKGDVAVLVTALQSHAFKVNVTDQFGAAAAPAQGHYLYASRSGDLARMT